GSGAAVARQPDGAANARCAVAAARDEAAVVVAAPELAVGDAAAGAHHEPPRRAAHRAAEPAGEHDDRLGVRAGCLLDAEAPAPEGAGLLVAARVANARQGDG